MDEQIASIEQKLAAIIGSITQHGAEEARLIHEAHKAIMERQSTDDDDTSQPSVIARMEKRVEGLSAHLRELEPLAEQSLRVVEDETAHKRQLKKKFGRMM